MGLVDPSTDNTCSWVGHWQSSLASVRKLSDTLIVEDFHSSDLFPCLCPCKQRNTILVDVPSHRSHGTLFKSLAVCPPQIVSQDAQQFAVE